MYLLSLFNHGDLQKYNKQLFVPFNQSATFDNYIKIPTRLQDSLGTKQGVNN